MESYNKGPCLLLIIIASLVLQGCTSAPLKQAVEKQNHPRLRELLEHEHSAIARMVALEEAVRRDDSEAVQILLDSGSFSRQSAIWLAARRENVAILRLLLSQGGEATEGLLVSAVRDDRVSVAGIFLDNGVDANASVNTSYTINEDNGGFTIIEGRGDQEASVLSLAVLSGSPRMVEILLEHGADPNRPVTPPPPSGSHPKVIPQGLFHSSFHEEKIAEAEARNGVYSVSDPYYFEADFRGVGATFKYGFGPPPTSITDYARTRPRTYPLLMACSNKDITSDAQYEIVELLLDAGAEQEMTDDNGDSALVHAKRAGNQRIVELLSR